MKFEGQGKPWTSTTFSTPGTFSIAGVKRDQLAPDYWWTRDDGKFHAGDLGVNAVGCLSGGDVTALAADLPGIPSSKILR
jgi:hypothetical protein